MNYKSRGKKQRRSGDLVRRIHQFSLLECSWSWGLEPKSGLPNQESVLLVSRHDVHWLYYL